MITSYFLYIENSDYYPLPETGTNDCNFIFWRLWQHWQKTKKAEVYQKKIDDYDQMEDYIQESFTEFLKTNLIGKEVIFFQPTSVKHIKIKPHTGIAVDLKCPFEMDKADIAHGVLSIKLKHQPWYLRGPHFYYEVNSTLPIIVRNASKELIRITKAINTDKDSVKFDL